MKYKLLAIPGALARMIGGIMYPPLGRWGDQTMNKTWPNVLLAPPELAALKRRDQLGKVDFYDELKAQGLQDFRGDALYQLTEKLLEISELNILRLRGEVSSEEYKAKTSLLGISEENAEKIFTLSKQRLDLGTVIRGIFRKIPYGKGEEDWKQELRDQGWTEERVKAIIDTSKFYPSPMDLVLWQAREVYEPDAIQKYGLKDELDRLELEPFYKAGIDDEQIANYWMAHWKHPEWGTVREMLFRTDFKEEDVWEWFRLVEIPPYWRDKLITIMYNPYTRVDVRRMYKFGVLDRPGVKRALMDIGYNEEKAENMTEFYVRWAEDTPEEEKTEEDKRKDELRGLSRAAILKHYRTGLLALEDAKGYLIDIGLSSEVVEVYIAQEDFKREEERVEEYLKVYHRQYLNGVIDYNNLIDELGRLNLPDKEVEYLVELWDTAKTTRASQPSKAELVRFTKKEIISLDVFKEMMSNLGYPLKYIEWYIKDYELISIKE